MDWHWHGAVDMMNSLFPLLISLGILQGILRTIWHRIARELQLAVRPSRQYAAIKVTTGMELALITVTTWLREKVSGLVV